MPLGQPMRQPASPTTTPRACQSLPRGWKTELCYAQILLPLPVLQLASSCDKALRLENGSKQPEREALLACPSARSDLHC